MEVRMRFEELTVPQVEALDRNGTVLILPLGSVEQHGRHMPLGTDTILASSLALSAADRRPGRIVVLPPPWYGFSPHHMAFAGTLTLQASTIIAMVEDVVSGLVAHGFRRILLLNGHGGNAGVMDVLASTLGHRFHSKARIAALTYFQLARQAIASIRESRAGGMGHACEFETAMMLHLRPEIVAMESAVAAYPDPGSTYLTTDLLGTSAVRTYHDFKDLSESGTFGDPMLATAEKGARFFEAVMDELLRFLDDFTHWRMG
jgi:creatinine amidohydrolase